MQTCQNSDKEHPSNSGKKWTDEEETLLFEELFKNIDIQTIAHSHNRTIGGINSRRREIAYEMYSNNTSMEEILLKTKLDEDKIIATITRRQGNSKKCSPTTDIKKTFSIECELYEMKSDIKELKNTIKDLVEMMKAVYEFADA